MTYNEMMIEYGDSGLKITDEPERAEIFKRFPYSVIVEGGHMELDSLEAWIKSNLGKDKFHFLYHGKTGYDFGFFEYFFEENEQAVKLARSVPDIYTFYPDSLRPGIAVKSYGYHYEIEEGKLPVEIQIDFFKFFDHDIPVGEFEQWVYASKELETYLDEFDHLDLIALNYKD